MSIIALINGLLIEFVHNGTPDHVGFIPHFLNQDDPRSATKQFHHKYSYGGGWNPMDKFKFDPDTKAIEYPGDPPYYPRAHIKFRHEHIYIYDHSWVAIVQPDGSFEVSRMD